MNSTITHRQAIMTPKPDKIEEVRQLLVQCEEQIMLRKAEGGPISWCAAFDEETNLFYVTSTFESEESLKFHQGNIGPILKGVPPLLAAPLNTTVRTVFAVAR